MSDLIAAVMKCPPTNLYWRVLLGVVGAFIKICQAVVDMEHGLPRHENNVCGGCGSFANASSGAQIFFQVVVRQSCRWSIQGNFISESRRKRLDSHLREARRAVSLSTAVESHDGMYFFRGKWLTTTEDRARALEFVHTALANENLNPQNYDIVVVFDDCDRSLAGTLPLSDFGDRPVYRTRCFYNKTKKEAAMCDKSDLRNRRLRLGPGLVLFVCPHRVVAGITLLTKFESPEPIFSALQQWFVFPPRIILYDLSCNLERYCMARNPVLFRDTLFVLDKFHERNHVTCSRAFTAQFTEDLQGVNTQVRGLSLHRSCWIPIYLAGLGSPTGTCNALGCTHIHTSTATGRRADERDLKASPWFFSSMNPVLGFFSLGLFVVHSLTCRLLCST
jgi:hypothetical protein